MKFFMGSYTTSAGCVCVSTGLTLT